MNTPPLDWSRIDTVLLDMDGTLLDLHFDNYFWLHHLPTIYAEKNALSHEAAHRELVERFGREQGHLNWYCVDFWSRELNLDIGQYKHDIVDRIQERPGAYAFMQAVRDSGRECWLVTNAHHKSLSLKLAHTPLSELCQRIFCSHDFGVAKESPQFWPALQAQAPFNPARSLFIDDSEAVLDSAARFGIAHLLTIAKPDSQRPARDGLRHPVLHHFYDIMPPRNSVL
jgi:5'-nucleotidase